MSNYILKLGDLRRVARALGVSIPIADRYSDVSRLLCDQPFSELDDQKRRFVIPVRMPVIVNGQGVHRDIEVTLPEPDSLVRTPSGERYSFSAKHGPVLLKVQKLR